MPPGPPPKPIELKVLEGNPGKRKLNKNAPKPMRVLSLKCPSYIGKYGKQVWKNIVSELSRLGMLTEIDQGALELYCRMYQKWRENEDFLIEKGSVFPIKDEKGRIKCLQPMPQVAIAHQSAEYCRKLLAEFGLTPAARSRLSIPIEKQISDSDLDEMEQWLDK